MLVWNSYVRPFIIFRYDWRLFIRWSEVVQIKRRPMSAAGTNGHAWHVIGTRITLCPAIQGASLYERVLAGDAGGYRSSTANKIGAARTVAQPDWPGVTVALSDSNQTDHQRRLAYRLFLATRKHYRRSVIWRNLQAQFSGKNLIC